MTTPDLVPRHRLHVDPMADCFCEMDVSATGNYVTFEDYERLQSRLEALEASATADAERLAAIEAMAREQHDLCREAGVSAVRNGNFGEFLGRLHALILDGNEKL